MAFCRHCNRSFEPGENKHNHTCDIVIVKLKDDDKGTSNKKVHANRVERGGDLYKDVTKGDWEVVYRSQHRLEKLFEEDKKRKEKKK